MNLYEVVTEEISEVVPILDDGSGPTEYFSVWGLVVAATAAKAKYILLSDNKLWGHDKRDVPKCTIRKLASEITAQPGVVSESGWALAILFAHQLASGECSKENYDAAIESLL